MTAQSPLNNFWLHQGNRFENVIGFTNPLQNISKNLPTRLLLGSAMSQRPPPPARLHNLTAASQHLVQ